MKRPVAFIIAVLILPTLSANAATLVGVTTTNNLVTFNSATPATITSTVPITGLAGGENIVGIDFRPATGGLYGLGSTSRLYLIDQTTGAATAIGTAGAFTLSGTDFGFDFNPTVDRIRVVSDADQDIRLNPITGGLAATDGTLAYAAGDVNTGVNPTVAAAAYLNSFSGTTTTTLYDIDTGLDILVTQNPPNSGTLNTIGSLGVDASTINGFDLDPNGNVGYAALQVGGVSNLYTINLSTGAATLVGPIGAGLMVSGLSTAAVGVFGTSIPTLSPYMMLLLVALLAAAAVIALRAS